MTKTIAILASVAALSFASGAQAGSNSSYFYNGGGSHHSGQHEDDDDHSSSGVCSRIRNDFLRRLCRKISDHDNGNEHPLSPPHSAAT